MAGPQNIFQHIWWATTYFLQFCVCHEANVLICLVKKFKNQYIFVVM